jgi:hypothetical protein
VELTGLVTPHLFWLYLCHRTLRLCLLDLHLLSVRRFSLLPASSIFSPTDSRPFFSHTHTHTFDREVILRRKYGADFSQRQSSSVKEEDRTEIKGSKRTNIEDVTSTVRMEVMDSTQLDS